MKQICKNCHFLSKEIREENTGRVQNTSISSKDREKAENGIVDFIPEYYSMKCYLGVWDEGVNSGKENRLSIVLKTKRKGKCFFLPYNPGMLFETAKALQRQQQEDNKSKRSNLYTRIALRIAFISLIFSAIVWILK